MIYITNDREVYEQKSDDSDDYTVPTRETGKEEAPSGIIPITDSIPEQKSEIIQIQKTAKLNRDNDLIYKAVCNTISQIKQLQQAAKNNGTYNITCNF